MTSSIPPGASVSGRSSVISTNSRSKIAMAGMDSDREFQDIHY